MREGVLAQKHLLIGKDGSPDNFDLNVGRTGMGGWRAPRHRHNFDQIRYVIEGRYPIGEAFDYPQLAKVDRICAARIACDSLSSTDSGAVRWTRVMRHGSMVNVLASTLPTNA
jgi:hypothetical protein